MNDLIWLSGTWFVINTNDPVWLKGNRQAPTYSFDETQQESGRTLPQEIKYMENGEMQTIAGINQPQKNNIKAFTWTGQTPNGPATLEWEVKLVDETGLWMVTWYAKSAYSPEVVHILGREPELDEATLEKIKKQMMADSVLKVHLPSLKAI